MSDFELSEQRGWGVYGQNPYTGKWRLDGAARSEMMAYTYAGESQRVEEVTIRPVCLGADPVQWAAVSVAVSFLTLLYDLRRFSSDRASFGRWGIRHKGEFGGSLEREEAAAPSPCRHAVPPERCLADAARKPGCLCQWEEGDSPCPVHGEDEEDGGGSLEREP